VEHVDEQPSGGSADGGVPAPSRMVSGYELTCWPRSSFLGPWLAWSGSSHYFSTWTTDKAPPRTAHGRVTPVTLRWRTSNDRHLQVKGVWRLAAFV
jgi:hypothetical protein